GGAGAGCLHVETQNVLEVGETVVAAEPEIVAEEAEHQVVGEHLGDDREIDAGDAAAEGEPAEHQGKHSWDQHDHDERVGEMLEAVPIDRQLGPVQEHHEIGPYRIGVDAAGADLPHQIHAHGVAAEREEGAVAKREDAAIAPDQIDRERQDRVADVFAEQRDEIARQVEGRGSWHEQIEQWHRDRDGGEQRQENGRAAVERAGEREGAHASTARPLSANSPRGRFRMNRMISTRIAILPSTAPANGSRNLLAMPSVKEPTSVPQRLPTPPNTTTMNESRM